MSALEEAALSNFLSKYIFGFTFGLGTVSHVKFCKTVITHAHPVQKDYVVKIVSRRKVPENFPVLIEPHILRFVHHDRIVKIFDWHLTTHNLYLVLEHCQGRTLYYYMEFLFKFPRDEIAKIMRDLASALVYLHNKRIIHRDINPKNLVLDVDNFLRVRKLKVIDFGTACYVTRYPPWYGCSTQFCAPELRFTQEYGCEVDVFSAGVVLCYLILGLELFDYDFCLNELDFLFRGAIIPYWFIDSPLLHRLIRGMLDKNKFSRFKAIDVLNDTWIHIFANLTRNIE